MSKIWIILAFSALVACSGGTVINENEVDESTKETAINTTGARPSDVPSLQETVSILSADEHCEAVIASVKEAGFEGLASVTCDHEYAIIHSNSYASHEMMTGIVGTNEQIPLPAPGYFASVRLSPSFTGEPQTRDSSLAIAVNGVPIFDYSAGGEMNVDDLYSHQPHLDTMLLRQVDICGGHTGRGDDYHYHEEPRCMIEQMDNKDDNPIIAWGFDGFPMYGINNPDGSPVAPGILDVCNGQADSVFGYRYHTSDKPPYIIQCIVGAVADLSALPSIGIERPSGRPVMVDNLTFEHDSLGAGLMTYDYQGEHYYIKSTSTEDESCFDVEWKSVTNGGVVESGNYCHIIRTGGGMGMGMGMGGGPREGGMGG